MRRLVLSAALIFVAAVAGAAAQAPKARIWQGVYTSAQAERGKATFLTVCIRCHGADLAGNTAPALKGEQFQKDWGGGSVARLFEKIRDTMPPQFGIGVLDDTQKIEIVAFILQTNGYPAGTADLTVGNDLAAIQIVPEGEAAKVTNFALVQTVGCLARDGDAWVLTRSSEPSITAENAPPAAALQSAAVAPLGSGRMVLLSAAQFDPASQVGRKVEARGLIYIDPAESLLTLTSLKAVGGC